MYSVMKVDLVIWTLNGEATITRCLDSIEKAVPASVICHRYLIDGGSVDATRDMAKRFGWTVAIARRRGIPFQAYQALRLVDTPVFASFEQDVGLNPAWFSALMPRLVSQPASSRPGFTQLITTCIGQRLSGLSGVFLRIFR